MQFLTSLFGGSENIRPDAAARPRHRPGADRRSASGLLKFFFRASSNVGRGRNRRLTIVDTMARRPQAPAAHRPARQRRAPDPDRRSAGRRRRDRHPGRKAGARRFAVRSRPPRPQPSARAAASPSPTRSKTPQPHRSPRRPRAADGAAARPRPSARPAQRRRLAPPHRPACARSAAWSRRHYPHAIRDNSDHRRIDSAKSAPHERNGDRPSLARATSVRTGDGVKADGN